MKKFTVQQLLAIGSSLWVLSVVLSLIVTFVLPPDQPQEMGPSLIEFVLGLTSLVSFFVGCAMIYEAFTGERKTS